MSSTESQMAQTIHILGGGIAGLSAAVRAIQQGYRPVLVERSPALGGRARSLPAKDLGCIIDNGQHVLAAGYHDTRDLLKTIGSLAQVDFPARLEIDFRIPDGRTFQFRSWPLPAPLHFLCPLLLKGPLSADDRRWLLRWGNLFRKTTADYLRPKTVREWLDEAGPCELLEQLLWEPLTIATLNTPINKASALLLFQVLNQAFLASAKRSGLGLPAAMLSDIFAGPAQEYILKHGGKIMLNTNVTAIEMADGAVSALTCRDGQSIPTKNLISALPPAQLDRLVKNSPELARLLPNSFGRFEYEPIITINFWLDNPLPLEAPSALVNSPIQWIFRRPELSEAHQAGFGYTAIISAARAESGKPSEYFAGQLGRELKYYFDIDVSPEALLRRFKVIKEKQATFSQTPDSLDWRPQPQTGIPNLFLAGDWIDTGLPATIESASLSGRLAIETLSR